MGRLFKLQFLGPMALFVATLSAELGYELGAAWELRVRGEWVKKGEGTIGDFYDKPAGGTVDASAFEGVVSEEGRVSGELAFAPSRRLRLSATVGTTSITSYRHEGGVDRDAQPFALNAALRW